MKVNILLIAMGATCYYVIFECFRRLSTQAIEAYVELFSVFETVAGAL